MVIRINNYVYTKHTKKVPSVKGDVYLSQGNLLIFLL